MNQMSEVVLNNGTKMPILGLGVYQIAPSTALPVFQWALSLGYRLFDTASLYGNEEEVGKTIRNSSIPRNEFFITTKLWNEDHGTEKAVQAFERSLEQTGLDYIDLYLIHWPVTDLRLDTWRVLESLLDTERVKAIGVSNYMIPHLEELIQECNITPAVNQVEFHPWLFQKDLLNYCEKNSIQLEAYSPLVKGKKLDEPVLINIAAKHAKTTAQVLIRWCIEHDVVVIPKSDNQKHLRENIDVFDFKLSADDMQILDNLEQGFVVSWDPRNFP